MTRLLRVCENVVADDSAQTPHRTLSIELRKALRRREAVDRAIAMLGVDGELPRDSPVLRKPRRFAVSSFDGSDALDEGHGIVELMKARSRMDLLASLLNGFPTREEALRCCSEVGWVERRWASRVV